LLLDFDSEEESKTSLTPRLTSEVLGISEWDGQGRGSNSYPNGLLLVTHTGKERTLDALTLFLTSFLLSSFALFIVLFLYILPPLFLYFLFLSDYHYFFLFFYCPLLTSFFLFIHYLICLKHAICFFLILILISINTVTHKLINPLFPLLPFINFDSNWPECYVQVRMFSVTVKYLFYCIFLSHISLFYLTIFSCFRSYILPFHTE
jgi:hypothetical protein